MRQFLQDILIDYMTSVINQAVNRAGGPGVRPTPEHLLHVVRKASVFLQDLSVWGHYLHALTPIL